LIRSEEYMSIRNTAILFTVALLSLVLLTCEQEPGNIVAEVGNGYTISFSELQQYHSDGLFGKRYHHSELRGYGEALNEMITKRLKLVDFFESELHEDSTLMQNIQRVISEELIVMYFEQQYLDKYITEEAVNTYYEKLDKEVTYRQIVLKKPGKPSQQKIESLRQKAKNIRQEVLQNKEFGELVTKYSEDPESAKKGGYKPAVTWNDASTNSFYRKIFSMKPGMVRVFERGSGFYIVKVERVEARKVQPLSQLREKIVNNLEDVYMEDALLDYDRDFKALLTADSLRWNEDALAQLVEWSRQDRFYQENYQDTLRKAFSGGRNFTIVTYPDGQVDLREYLRLLNNVLLLESTKTITAQDIKDYIKEAIRTDIVLHKARELNLDEKVITRDTPSKVLRDEFIGLYNRRKIYEQIPEATEDALREFYQEHRDSLFYQQDKVNIYAIIRESKQAATDLWNTYEQGTSFEDLSRSWQVRTFVRNRNGEIQSFASSREPHLGKEAFRLKEGEITGPIEFTDPDRGTQYAIIKCVKKRQAGYVEFSETRDTIRETFREFHERRLRDSLKRSLREKYRIEVHRDVIRQKIANT